MSAPWNSLATRLRVPGGAWTRRRPLVAQALAEVRADVVGLQEDSQDLGCAEGGSQSAQLAADLGYACGAVPNTWEGGVRKGNAVLSRHPILGLRAAPLPAAPGEAERHGAGVRDALHAAIQTPCGLIHFFVAHLTTRGEAARLAEAAHLLAHVQARATDGTAIVVGDLNALPQSETVRLLTGRAGAPRLRLRDAWAEANAGDPGLTMLFHTPRTPGETGARIDYVLVGPGPEVVRAVLLGTEPDADGFYPSDHFGVAATLRWPAPRQPPPRWRS